MAPYCSTDTATLYQGDALQILPTLPPQSFDAVITDPPYSSGGLMAGDRRQDPITKYQHSGTQLVRSSFGGDNKDQRSFTWWTMAWLAVARQLLKPGGYCLVFTDWRQLPAVTDAMQAADFTWRGVIAWDKGPSARAPHKGYVRHQCEYIVWGTNGRCEIAEHDGPYPGCYSVPVDRKEKRHLTGKPTKLLRELVRVVPPGGRILDPFAGSASTLVAATLEGRHAVGIERETANCIEAADWLLNLPDETAPAADRDRKYSAAAEAPALL